MTGIIIGEGITINSGISITPEYDIPFNISAPVISGNASVNSNLVSTTGNWSTISAPSYTYQWQANSSNIVGATANTYTLTTNELGDNILCIVTATNIYGNTSVPSNTLGPVLANVPLAPTSVSATSSNGNAFVSFTAPINNGGSPIISYTVSANTGGITATGASSPITVTGLTVGNKYTFTVTATNSIGTGPASTASAAIPIIPPLGTSFRGGYYVGGNATVYTVVVDTSYEGTALSGIDAQNYYFGDTINGYTDWDAGTLVEHDRAFNAQSELTVAGQEFDSTIYWTGQDVLPLSTDKLYWKNYSSGAVGNAFKYTFAPYNGPSYPVRGFRRGTW